MAYTPLTQQYTPYSWVYTSSGESIYSSKVNLKHNRNFIFAVEEPILPGLTRITGKRGGGDTYS